MKKSYTIGTIVFITLVIVVFFNRIVDFIVNIQWFKEVGYTGIYFTRIIATLKLMAPLAIVLFIGLWLYYKGIRKNIIKMKRVVEVDVDGRKRERKIFILVNTVLSIFIAYLIASNYWYKVLQFANSKDFGVKDPIFSKDISFYVFKLPLIDSLYKSLLGLLIFIVIITLLIFFIMLASDSLSVGVGKKEVINSKVIKNGITQFAGKQLAVVSALFLVLISGGYIIRGYKILYSMKGFVYGAGYTDVKVTLLASRILAAACFISAIVVLVSILKSIVKPIIISITSIVVLVIIEYGAVAVVENWIVISNQIAFEEQYIKNNIEYTRKAFNIDNINEIEYPVSNTLKKQDIEGNKDIISNIKLNSYKQSLNFYNQVQILKYYYGFNDIDIDRYNIKGKYSQVFLAPREMNSDTIDTDTWINKHLIYTHGFGVVMSKVNAVTAEGQPDFLIKDIPAENKSGIHIANPRIYFGESTNDYAVVNTGTQEFDYPDGSDNEYYSYSGKAGIKMGLANKILYAIREQNIEFLLSGYINSDSKILINRNIVERVKKIAPFLMFDTDPYMVISKGKLYWIIDAYTYSDMYPYSQPHESNINYIRNSVKVIVDAYDGDTNFYIVDDSDPIIESYNTIFKGLFKSADELPEDIKEHFRYPEDLFNIQCDVLSKYHMTDPMVFITGDDLWQVAMNQNEVEGEKVENEAAYIVTRLPKEKKEEMVLLEYFNIRDKETMTAMLGARMDGENYGKLVLYKFPTQQTVYGPYLFQNKKQQDTTISKEISLWNTEGSRVEYGDTMIIPINNSLVYIEPMYLIAQGVNTIPEMKRVIVSNGEKIVMAENIDKAFEMLLNINSSEGNKVTPSPGQIVSEESKEIIEQAKTLYNSAIEAQKQGDWAKYGELINQLGELLNGPVDTNKDTKELP